MEPMPTSREVDGVALLRSPETKAAVTDALKAAGITTARAIVGELKQPGLRIIGPGARHQFLLLDVNLEDASDIAALEKVIKKHGHEMAIVVTSANPTVEGCRLLMRLGIVDVVPQPIHSKDLVQALNMAVERQRRTTDASRPPPAQSVVLSFLKAGGGLGTTALIVQAACALARDKGKSQVCVLDFDVQFGSAALYLDLPQKLSLLDLMQSVDQVDGSMLRDAMAHHRCGVDVLAAPLLVHPLDAVTLESVNAVIEAARREYRYVLIDLPQAWTGWTRGVLNASDGVALVLQLTVPAVRQARRQIDTLLEEGLNYLPLSTIANRVETGLFNRPKNPDGGVTAKEAEAVLKRHIDYTVPNDFQPMFKAISLGQPLWEVPGGRSTSRRIGQAIGKIMTSIEAVDAPAAAHK